MRTHPIVGLAFSAILFAACQPVRVVRPTAAPVPAQQPAPAPTPEPVPQPVPAFLTLPVANYREGRTLKVFGQEVHDRFNGFHAGDDVEVGDKSNVVPVHAIADGTVVLSRRVGGYGGVLVVRHTIGSGPNPETVSALYGHLNLAQAPGVGARVRRGQPLATLGDHESEETDGERKHLHFQLWARPGIQLAGYTATRAGLSAYLNPTTFFQAHGIAVPAATAP